MWAVYAPSSFELLESLISDLAENYGLQTISLTPEELRRQAEQNFAKAEDYYGNREARGSNLRDAIRRYRLVVGALEQFSPASPALGSGAEAPGGGRVAPGPQVEQSGSGTCAVRADSGF